MAPLRHFITGDFEKRTVFLPDKEYGLALDALVKGCADVLITSGAGPSLRILLGKRRVEPQPDWWFVGGRTRPGDTPAEGAARNRRGTYSFVWRLRAQAPATNGTADVSTVFELHLADDEAADLSPARFDAEEYADAAWTRPDAVLAGDYHPALQQAVRDLLARRAYGALRDAAADASAGAGAVAAPRGLRRLARVRADGRCKVRFEDGAYVFVDPATGAAAPRPATGAAYWAPLLGAAAALGPRGPRARGVRRGRYSARG
ncbi:hypothetical protein JL720_14121 [Aureococcus anophagefferens]|nr:hypothetical protein JL720_14121 [Aureococcus anophagefferens]